MWRGRQIQELSPSGEGKIFAGGICSYKLDYQMVKGPSPLSFVQFKSETVAHRSACRPFILCFEKEWF